MLDFVFGEPRSNPAVDSLIAALKPVKWEGTLYVGYPVLSSLDGVFLIDALLTCRQHGVVAFDLSSAVAGNANGAERLKDIHDNIHALLNSKFLERKELRDGRDLAFDINVISLVPEKTDQEVTPGDVVVASPDELTTVIAQFPKLPEHLIPSINSAVQRTATLKPKKRRANVKDTQSCGSVLKTIEQNIANLDAWQKKAAIEYPDGPQRIRGLAGSGKTIVLAQKASFLHAKHPDWDIALTFHTRSLYQQFRNLVRRFSFEISKDEPDWTKLKIIHSWGSPTESGIYYEIASSVGLSVRDFNFARRHYGYNQAFAGVCREILEKIDSGMKPKQLFDAVLIDEAQDFPKEFFQIVYHATRSPKRVVWAYDELQNLGDYSMPPAQQLFGKDSRGSPRVELKNADGQPLQDIVLPVCYRNTPWALVTAHALGFGIYRAEGLVQMFDDPELWNQIGYECKSGELRAGRNVVLTRRATASPKYFYDLLNRQDAVSCHVFKDVDAQCRWVAKQIKKNVTIDELDKDDILIVVADPSAVRSVGARMMSILQEKKLRAHLAGVTASRDILFFEESIAITGIFRAKGNEAPMVYLLGAEHCLRGFELGTKRNILFTAITRSRAWVRVCGVGPDMESLKKEIDIVSEKEFRLDFKYPTLDDIKKLRRIHRDMPRDQKSAIQQDIEGLIRLVKRIEDGELEIETLPKKIRSAVESLIGRDQE